MRGPGPFDSKHISIRFHATDDPTSVVCRRNIVGMTFHLECVTKNCLGRKLLITNQRAERNTCNDSRGAAAKPAPKRQLVVYVESHGGKSPALMLGSKTHGAED